MHHSVATSAPHGPVTAADSAQSASDALAADLTLHPSRHRMLTGDRPTGPLHLGHYLSSLRERVRLQDLGVPTLVVIADYQVITDREDPGDLREHVLGMVADYLAAGTDPERTTIFTHSAVPALNQLLLPFLALVTLPELERNPTVKAELSASRRPLSGLLLTYPVHQAADLLFAKADVVPVGRDQLPHLEQARVIARRFNARYGAGREVFPEPRPLLNAAATILGLDGAKMSKSRGNAIPLRASEDETADLVRRAKTDAQRRITYDPVGRPEVANLVLVAAMLRDEPVEAVAGSVGDGGAAALKTLVTEAVNETLRGYRARRRALAGDSSYLLGVLREGNRRANAIADQTLTEVRRAMSMEL